MNIEMEVEPDDLTKTLRDTQYRRFQWRRTGIVIESQATSFAPPPLPQTQLSASVLPSAPEAEDVPVLLSALDCLANNVSLDDDDVPLLGFDDPLPLPRPPKKKPTPKKAPK